MKNNPGTKKLLVQLSQVNEEILDINWKRDELLRKRRDVQSQIMNLIGLGHHRHCPVCEEAVITLGSYQG